MVIFILFSITRLATRGRSKNPGKAKDQRFRWSFTYLLSVYVRDERHVSRTLHSACKIALRAGAEAGSLASHHPGMRIEVRIYAMYVLVVEMFRVELVVKEAAPAVKGNTTSGATKEVMLETGATLQVPQFINEGDIIRVNTETGEYAERVEKA